MLYKILVTPIFVQGLEGATRYKINDPIFGLYVEHDSSEIILLHKTVKGALDRCSYRKELAGPYLLCTPDNFRPNWWGFITLKPLPEELLDKLEKEEE